MNKTSDRYIFWGMKGNIKSYMITLLVLVGYK